jgi:glycosyltransferase involved in cell wall biosynthesis
MSPPLGAKQLRWARSPAVARLAGALGPDVIIERYYNFGGEGIRAATSVGAIGVLEVNAPVIDHAGSRKAAIDKAMVIAPMRRWRERLCAAADLIVTPNPAILPAATPAAKIVTLEWGADTDRFRPDARGPLRFARPRGLLAVFAGAFRSWHGAVHLVHAIRQLRNRGQREVSAVFIGEGPELTRTREAAQGMDGVQFVGAVPHSEMPQHLAAADVGVAPFDPSGHAPLSLGFYWSPLKIFEYMAAGLPVVAPAIHRMASLVSNEIEGILYPPSNGAGIADALDRLRDASLRARLGQAARARAVSDFSWAAHCRDLETAFTSALARKTGIG